MFCAHTKKPRRKNPRLISNSICTHNHRSDTQKQLGFGLAVFWAVLYCKHALQCPLWCSMLCFSIACVAVPELPTHNAVYASSACVSLLCTSLRHWKRVSHSQFRIGAWHTAQSQVNSSSVSSHKMVSSLESESIDVSVSNDEAERGGCWWAVGWVPLLWKEPKGEGVQAQWLLQVRAHRPAMISCCRAHATSLH